MKYLQCGELGEWKTGVEDLSLHTYLHLLTLTPYMYYLFRRQGSIYIEKIIFLL